ncbi:hypothetical protein [uncultured Desulfobacter sp.]|uniref:hypothetical protein n=1 Tax=uncultured Desulfobacter sp. TaxID=240139 RepID=UPI002AAAD4ED|nr:hypothetical protein [uncultured Desulfobacter sp.]
MTAISGIRTHIFIGDLELLRCPECRVAYVRDSHLSRATIVLPDPGGVLYRRFEPGDAVTIRMGYRYQEPDEWQGTVSHLAPPDKKDQIAVRAVGLERALSETPILQSWVDETPEKIITWALNQTGLPVGQIGSPGVSFPRFTASNITVWQVARQCEHTCTHGHGIDMAGWELWMDRSGNIHWNAGDEDADLPVIETGRNLIRHLPAPDNKPGRGSIEALLIAGLRRRMQIRLIDRYREIDQAISPFCVEHVLKPEATRTFMQYGVAHEKF